MNEEKFKQAIAKLISLTSEQKLIWKLTSNIESPYKIYKSKYLQQLVGKFDFVFYVSNLKYSLKIQDENLVLFEFPDFENELSKLYQEILKQALDIDKLLNSILEDLKDGQ